MTTETLIEQTEQQTDTVRLDGFIRSLTRAEGWGFISPANGNDRYFFHASDVKNGGPFDSLRVGRAVQFTPIDMSKARRERRRLKDRAVNIHVIAG